VVGRLALAVSLGVSAALVALTTPAEASGEYAPRNGIGYVNLHERIPDYHVRVLVPQLLDDGAAAAAANHVLRQDAANVTAGWRRKAVAELRGIASGFPKGRIPAGAFSILPNPSLVASSTRLVDAILPVSSNYPNGVNNGWWAHSAALLPSGDAIDLAHVLFTRPSQGLVQVARLIRRELAKKSPAADVCTLHPVLGNGGRPIPSMGVFVRGIVQAHALAILSGGLEVGIDQGYLGSDSCGLAQFLVPLRQVLPYVTPLGQSLIESFLNEPKPFVQTYSVPVRVCQTSYPVSPWGRGRKIPKTLAIAEPAWIASELAVYTDSYSFNRVLGPRGWSCSAAYGEDGGGGMTIAPPGSNPNHVGTEGISLGSAPACLYCQLVLACPYFESARQVFYRMYPNRSDATDCREVRGENVTPLQPSFRRVDDPSRVKGLAGPSGGPYWSLGIAHWQGFTNKLVPPQGSYIMKCALPSWEHSLCYASLQWYMATSTY
jgi:hypothetical protein